jgi:hypothetical protein
MKAELTLSVNGTQRETPLDAERSLGDLLDILRIQYNSETCCISAIKIDDQEISEREEAAYSLLPLSDLHKIEITTAHPRELAEDTLQSLVAFTEHLSNLATTAGELFQKGEHPSIELAKFFDGMQTFSDAFESAKQVIKPGHIESLHVLQVDLLSLMQDTIDAYHENNSAYLADLLVKHIPENLSRWRESGIPALIRSRDS